MTEPTPLPTVLVTSTTRIATLAKRCLVTSVTKADQYRVGDTWYSAKGIDHNTAADEVRHFGRYTSLKGSIVQANAMLAEPSITIQILSIRAVNPKQLPPESFPPLGYIDFDDYMSEWGKVFGERVWLLAIKPVAVSLNESDHNS